MHNCPDRLANTAREAGCDILTSLRPDDGVAAIVVRLPEGPCRLLEQAYVLSPSERDRADKFRFAKHRDLFCARRILLRLWLADELHTRPEDIRLDTTPQGKPFVIAEGNDSPIADFSISSSSNSIGLALHSTGRVGMDIEYGHAEQDIDSMLESICSPEESRILQHLAPATKAQAFYQLWTAKEAYLKALGTGFLQSPDSVTFQWDTSTDTPHLKPDSLEGWRLEPFALPCGCHGSVCWERTQGAWSFG